MKKIPTLLLLLASWAGPLAAQTDNVGIGTTTPDPSAALDITSSDKGLLPPRLTTTQRLGISNPAEGLVVYDTNSGAFYFFNGAQWLSLSGADTSAVIADADNDTKVEVEQNTDEDVIRFSLGGTERWVMAGARLENRNSGNSVFFGEGAGASDDGSENRNVAVGYQALFSNTSGSFNAAFGSSALYFNTVGSENTAIGNSALYSNTTGGSNTAIGNSTLSSNTTGNYNTSIGIWALSSNTEGSENTATGALALHSNTTGSRNTANGMSALRYNTEGSFNTASGCWSLLSNTFGVFNTAYGSSALTSNTTGSHNTANGGVTLSDNTEGNYNTATGIAALHSNTTGSYNTANGTNALFYNITGNYNTALGFAADVNFDSLTNATAIGYNAKVGCSNCLVLGGTGADAVNVGIGTTTPASTLEVNGAVTATSFAGDGSALTGIDVNDADADPTNELITSAALNGNTLEITDAGGTQTVDLSSLAGAGTSAVITDTDNDTKVEVERDPDEDLIRFDLAGTEHWVMAGPRLENRNSGNSVFLGEGAGASDDLSSNSNVAVGYQALNLNNSGFNNTAAGSQALAGNTIGSHNTAYGYQALSSNIIGYDNMGLGYLADVTSGNLNKATAIGYNAKVACSNCLVLGGTAADAVNVGIGTSFVLNKMDVEGNMAVGANYSGALAAPANGAIIQGSVGIGTPIPYNRLDVSGGLAVGVAYSGGFTAPTNGAIIQGRVGIGTSSPANQLDVEGSLAVGGLYSGLEAAPANGAIIYGSVGIGTSTPGEKLQVEGNICYTGAIGACSDARYKKGLQPITGALARLREINGIYYYWKKEDFPEKNFSGSRQIGLIAQEVEARYPELVLTGPDGYMSVDYSRLTPVLLEAVKELSRQAESQQAEIARLRSELSAMDELEQRLARLEAALLPSDQAMGKVDE